MDNLMNLNKKKKEFKMPHTFVIIMGIIVLSAVLTWIIPAGMFDRAENSLGMTVINPDSFSYIASSPVSILQIPKYIIEGFLQSADLFFLILFSGCAFDVITSSGALQAAVGKVAKKFSKKEAIFIPVLSLIFALICTTQGVNIFIGFAPITVMIARTMGFDSIVGASVILLGGAVGFSTGTLNTSTTIVGQKLAELPLYSGLGYRAFCFVVFLIVTNIYLVKYAKKIRKNPSLSPMYELDLKDASSINGDLNSIEDMKLRDYLVMLSLMITLIVIVYGGMNLGWGLEENTMAFIWLGIIAGIFAGYDANKIASCFVNGAKKMISAAMIIGMARAVSGILADGVILDTIVNSMGEILMILPRFLQSIAMFIANLFINMFITSGSGQAAVVMPMFVPLADMVGITRQTVLLAFNFGDGFCNYVLPTSTALMGILSVSNIPYDKWMKFMWKLFLIWIVVGSLLILGAQIINLGPI